MADVRLVVFHRPGPGWVEGVDFRDQPGVGEHVAHYASLLERGLLDLGGPFLKEQTGGMMVASGISRDELQEFAAADPAVASGLLEYEIRDWYIAMRRDD